MEVIQFTNQIQGKSMIDKIELKKCWDTFVGEGNFTEVRILGKFSYSGYFKSFDNLCKQLEPYTEMDDEQIYFIFNSIEESCYARPQCEKFIKSAKVTTNDANVHCRRFLLLDFDPVRVSQTASSNESFELAHKRAQQVYKYLREEGFGDMIVAISGNGWHLMLPVNIPCDDETDLIIKNFYKYMGSKFSDDKVDFDETVCTRARLTKLYSTWAKKGANLPSNPWRQSKIVYVPKEQTPTPIGKIKEIADLLPPEEPKQVINHRAQYNGDRFDLVSWLTEHGVEYKVESNGSGTKYVLRHCPWESTHSSVKEYESALFQDADGKIKFSCFHSHCKDKQWSDFRLNYQPDAYDRPLYQPQYRQYVPTIPQKPKYEIKEELPELGEKWMSMSSIKKVDITQLEKAKTGFTELDRKIGGLYMSEVTVLSGSNSSGKSSWLNSLLLNIVQQGYKIALWSGELRADILKTWIQMVAAGARNLKQSQYDDGRYYVPDNVGRRIDEWLDGKFFLYNNGYGTKAEQILHDMEILLQAGVKVFALDNMMSLDVDLFDGDKNNKQKELILRIKDFAMRNMVHVILVAHPRKVTTFLRKTDISGTSDITNAVDNCIIIHRTNEDFLHAITEFYDASKANKYRLYGNVLSVEKNRLFGVVDFMCGFHYDIASRRFKNTEYEDIHYGWEAEPVQASLPYKEEKDEGDMPFAPPSEEESPF